MEKVISVMEQYHVFKKKVDRMNNKTLKKALTIIDSAVGVSHDDFFEIAVLLFLVDKMNISMEDEND